MSLRMSLHPYPYLTSRMYIAFQLACMDLLNKNGKFSNIKYCLLKYLSPECDLMLMPRSMTFLSNFD